MIKNKYTSTVDSWKISNEALEKALQTARCAESHSQEEKVISMKERKGKLGFKLTAAIAACLAAAIALGGLWHGENVTKGIDGSEIVSDSLNNSTHTFTLTANAAEITKDTEVTLGRFENNGGESGGGYKVDESGNLVSEFMLSMQKQFTVNCEGEDLESITYSVEDFNNDILSMYFRFYSDFDGVIAHNSTDKDYKFEYTASEITVDYNKQPTPNLIDYGDTYTNQSKQILFCMDFSGPVDGITGRSVNSIRNFGSNNTEQMLKDYNKALEYFMGESEDNLKIRVTANFTDGTHATKYIKLSYEPKTDSEDMLYLGCNMKATIAD